MTNATKYDEKGVIRLTKMLNELKTKKNKKKKSEYLWGFLKFVFTLIGTTILWIVVALMEGYVLTHLWRWFILPVFNLPALAIYQATGIMIVLSYIKTSNKYCKGHELDTYTNMIGAFTTPWLYLFIGWMIKVLFFG